MAYPGANSGGGNRTGVSWVKARRVAITPPRNEARGLRGEGRGARGEQTSFESEGWDLNPRFPAPEAGGLAAFLPSEISINSTLAGVGIEPTQSADDGFTNRPLFQSDTRPPLAPHLYFSPLQGNDPVWDRSELNRHPQLKRLVRYRYDHGPTGKTRRRRQGSRPIPISLTNRRSQSGRPNLKCSGIATATKNSGSR